MNRPIRRPRCTTTALRDARAAQLDRAGWTGRNLILDEALMRKHERRKIDAFELWCWRRVLRVSWMERKTNISIIETIKPEWTLELRVAKAALSYFGHVVRARGMEDDVMLGRMNGARKRGRPRQRWLDTLNGYASGATISNMRGDARDRAGWIGATTAVARGRMRLDGTRWQGVIKIASKVTKDAFTRAFQYANAN